ncbi:hypothetical protein Micbo1qcDRAFT_57875 [Microdochium bolleyi]|uniref:Ubiquitin-like domain-containing protein n=1 Tax=Microdochium bolleyi TaxID=196109 RepID=A0A136J3Q6_9PEZI|nr:hypothetical protein Micbo1qcDRAFT_57875 [Microdochium bolleyi]
MSDASFVPRPVINPRASANLNIRRPERKVAGSTRELICFTDAIGRKFKFPFDKCRTWSVREILHIFSNNSQAGAALGYRSTDQAGFLLHP